MNQFSKQGTVIFWWVQNVWLAVDSKIFLYHLSFPQFKKVLKFQSSYTHWHRQMAKNYSQLYCTIFKIEMIRSSMSWPRLFPCCRNVQHFIFPQNLCYAWNVAQHWPPINSDNVRKYTAGAHLWASTFCSFLESCSLRLFFSIHAVNTHTHCVVGSKTTFKSRTMPCLLVFKKFYEKWHNLKKKEIPNRQHHRFDAIQYINVHKWKYHCPILSEVSRYRYLFCHTYLQQIEHYMKKLLL